eukprot:scaffold1669_cov129-Cylindrotheca_fusiformis.AAC.7
MEPDLEFIQWQTDRMSRLPTDCILSISNIRNSDDAASMLESARDSQEILVLRKVVIDQVLCDALSKSLQDKRDSGKQWKDVELRNVSGDITSAISICMASDAVAGLYLLVNNMELDHEAWSSVGRNLCSSKLPCLRITTDLSALGINSISDGLSGTSCLRTLEFNCSNFEEDETISELAKGLSGNTSIETLCFRSCSITDPRLAQLVEAVCDHPHLKTLDLNGNKAGSVTSTSVANLLSMEKSCLQKLDLSFQSNREEKVNIDLIVERLRQNKSLRALDLSDCKVNDKDVESLCTLFSESETLESVFLERNKITNVGLAMLANTLPYMKSIRRLELWGNSFDEEGLNSFVVGLENNYILEEANLISKVAASDTIAFYTTLNKAGRRLMQSPNVPLGLWPLVIEKLCSVSMPKESSFSIHDLRHFMVRGPAFSTAHV